MDSGLLTHAHDLLQLVILAQTQRDGDLVQPVGRKYHGKIGDPSDHLHSFIYSPRRHIVIQDPPDDITPLGIRLNPVYIFLCGTAVSYQYDLLLIQAPTAHIPQKREDQHPGAPFQDNIDPAENIDHQPGKIALLKHVKSKYDQQHTQNVSLDDIGQNKAPALHMHGLIKSKSLIQQKVSRNNKNQGEHILLKTECEYRRIGERAYEADHPGSDIGDSYDNDVKQHLETTEILLIVLNQSLPPQSISLCLSYTR